MMTVSKSSLAGFGSVGHATSRTAEESYGRISVKRSFSDLNQPWESAAAPRCKNR